MTIALSEADKLKLKKFTERGVTGAYILLTLVLIGIIAIGYGFTFLPGASWPSIAIPFVLLFAFGLFMSMRERNKAKHDLQAGMKEAIEGIVVKKKISQGNQTIDYDSHTLQLMAKRVEEEEEGKPITQYGALDAELNNATRYWFGVEVGKENFNVGVRFYVQVKEGDKVKLEVAPKSRVILSAKVL